MFVGTLNTCVAGILFTSSAIVFSQVSAGTLQIERLAPEVCCNSGMVTSTMMVRAVKPREASHKRMNRHKPITTTCAISCCLRTGRTGLHVVLHIVYAAKHDHTVAKHPW